MAQLFKCVVFDLDGTLLDTSEGILSAVRHTIKCFELEELSEETIKSFIGPPIQDTFRRLYGFEEEKIKAMCDCFRNYYKDNSLLEARPYEGIYELFDYLNAHGIIPAVATYKREDYALTLLKHFDFDKYTDAIYGSDFEGKLKKKDIIELALKRAGVEDYSEALMIGDSDNDAIGAEGIGTKFLGVTYGFGFKSKEDVKAFKCIGAADSPNEIIAFLENM